MPSFWLATLKLSIWQAKLNISKWILLSRLDLLTRNMSQTYIFILLYFKTHLYLSFVQMLEKPSSFSHQDVYDEFMKPNNWKPTSKKHWIANSIHQATGVVAEKFKALIQLQVAARLKTQVWIPLENYIPAIICKNNNQLKKPSTSSGYKPQIRACPRAT